MSGHGALVSTHHGPVGNGRALRQQLHAYGERSPVCEPKTVSSMTSSPASSPLIEHTTSPVCERRRRHVHEVTMPFYLGLSLDQVGKTAERAASDDKGPTPVTTAARGNRSPGTCACDGDGATHVAIGMGRRARPRSLNWRRGQSCERHSRPDGSRSATVLGRPSVRRRPRPSDLVHNIPALPRKYGRTLGAGTLGKAEINTRRSGRPATAGKPPRMPSLHFLLTTGRPEPAGGTHHSMPRLR